MKRKIIIFTVMLSLILSSLVGCGKHGVVQEEAKRRESTGESWTVMIYMCGSLLEEEQGLAGKVLNSLAYDLPENINVVVETGGAKQWSVNDIYADYNQDFIVQKNGIRLITQTAASNMGQSGTLSSFFNRSMESFPAEHYMGIIWDHGGGPTGGVAFDSNNSFDSLTTRELSVALSNTKNKLDIIGFDAGLMSNYEVASSVALYADYMVASEDIMSVNGWDYNRLFEYISNDPSADTIEIGKNICDGVAERSDKTEEYFVSMAVIDLSRQSTLKQQFEIMAADMDKVTNDMASLRGLECATSRLEMLGGNSRWEGYSNIADIGEFTEIVSNRVGESAKRVLKCINESVVYKNTSDYRKSLYGMSLFYPSQLDGDEITKYIKLNGDNNYTKFIEKTAVGVEIENRDNNPEDTIAMQQYAPLAKDNVLSISFEPNSGFLMSASHIEIIKGAAVNYYVYNQKEQQYVYLYRDYNTKFASGGYTYKFSGKIPELNGTPVSMYRVSGCAEYDIFSIPVMRDGKTENIRVARSTDENGKNTYKYLGIWQGVGKFTGMATRSAEKLETGDVFTPLYEVYGENGNKYIEGSKIRVGFGEVKIADKAITGGNYMASFTAFDIYGKETESKTVTLSVTGGNIQPVIN